VTFHHFTHWSIALQGAFCIAIFHAIGTGNLSHRATLEKKWKFEEEKKEGEKPRRISI
jgi:hypothetical protein